MISDEDKSCATFERRLLLNYKLDEVNLRHLGFFFLVHSHIDIKLIAQVVKYEIEKLKRRRGELSLDDYRELSVKWSGNTFKQHLIWVKERNLIGSEELSIAEETNRARDHFVHFEVGRFRLPHYFGQDVTSEAGYRRFLLDAMKFEANVPFPTF